MRELPVRYTTMERKLFEKLPENLYIGGFNDPNSGKISDLEKIGEIRKWVNENLIGLKSINLKRNSYGYKHSCEKEKDKGGIGKYVASGEFTAAMILEGFQFKPTQGTGINAYFNAGIKRNKRKIIYG